MTTQRPLLLAAGLLSCFVFACAGDPNKQASDAHDAELKAERKQVQSDADKRSDTRVDAAENHRDATESNARGTSATKDRVSADAKLTEARSVHRAKATERLEKLNARTAELKTLVEKAGPKATTSARDALKTVETQHSMVARDLDRLPSVADDAWMQAKDSLEGQLDTLDGLVKKAATEVEKTKK